MHERNGEEMAKYTDWTAAQDVKDLAEQIVEHFPGVFESFDSDSIYFIKTIGKSADFPIKVRTVSYPNQVFVGKPYIMEVFDKWWGSMDRRQQNIALFDAMCSFPEGGFDEQSKDYGKLRKPEVCMHLLTYAACGGVPNWMDNSAAVDPMTRTADDVVSSLPSGDGPVRKPITAAEIANMDVL